MNGIHDLGGTDGFGRVEVEPDEPVFHHEWERKVFGITLLTMIHPLYNIDEFRHAIERMDPAEYLASSYYEHWLAAVERLMIEKGVTTADELRRRAATLRENPQALDLNEDHSSIQMERVRMAIERGGNYRRELRREPRFKPGDHVQVRNLHPVGHTRCARYTRRAQGTIVRVHGGFVFPDTNAHGRGENPQPLYTVRFSSRELFGPGNSTRHMVYVDMWESYLEAGPGARIAQRGQNLSKKGRGQARYRKAPDRASRRGAR